MGYCNRSIMGIRLKDARRRGEGGRQGKGVQMQFMALRGMEKRVCERG